VHYPALDRYYIALVHENPIMQKKGKIITV